MWLYLPVLAVLLGSLCVDANVEKQIFVSSPASDAITWRDKYHDLVSRGVPVLTPERPNMRRSIHAAFPHSPALREPKQAWFLLDELEADRRYEIRASFGAMQPCDVNQSIATIEDVYTNARLLAELEAFLDTQRHVEQAPPPHDSVSSVQPVLYQVLPQANFFTTDQDLMRDGHIVDFDFTLDPFLLNVFPASLLPTAFYITFLSFLAFALSTVIWPALRYVAQLESSKKSKTNDQNKTD